MTSSPTHSFTTAMRACIGINASLFDTSAASRIELKPPLFYGTMPSTCGDTRRDAGMSSRGTLLIPVNSSLAATLLTGIKLGAVFLTVGRVDEQVHLYPARKGHTP